MYLYGKVRGGGDQYGLSGLLHQYDRVRGGGAGTRTRGGAGAYPRAGTRTGGGNTGTILLILAVALVGGGAGGYFKVYRPKQQRATEAVEEDYGDELDAFDDLEDDTPPWDEDEV